MNLKEKNIEATASKEKGNQQFKQQKFKEALVLYQEGLDILSDEPDDPEEKEFIEIKLGLLNNSSLMNIKLGKWSESIEFSNKALQIDSNNSKSLFRRAQARMNYGLFKEAREDIVKAIKLEPQNKEFRKFFEEFKKKCEEAKEKEKKQFGGLFNKLDMYGEKAQVT